MRVNFYATLRQVVGQKHADLDLPDGSTVRQAVDETVRQFPALRRELLDENGDLYGHIHLFVNGRDVTFLEHQLNTPLGPEDTVSLFPPVGGGSTTISLQPLLNY
jgi:molybdopterin synthase sulfur carrier subunit